MIRFKLYLYDSEAENHKGEEFSQYLSQGVEAMDNLDDTIDTLTLTLYGYNKREEFLPTTKFILDIEELSEGEVNEWVIAKTYHLVVESDGVSQPLITDDNYFDHSISFKEPTVIAQQRLCDNMAFTYKLKDVTLDIAPTYDESLTTVHNKQDTTRHNTLYSDDNGLRITRPNIFQEFWTYKAQSRFVWEMPNKQVEFTKLTMTTDVSPDNNKIYYYYEGGQYKVLHENEFEEGVVYYEYKLQTSVPTLDDLNNLLSVQILKNADEKKIVLPIPMLRCTTAVLDPYSQNNNFENVGYCSIVCYVTETDRLTGESQTTSITINPTSDEWDNKQKDIPFLQNVKDDINNGYLVHGYNAEYVVSFGYRQKPYLSKIATIVEERPEETIIITLKSNKNYNVKFSFAQQENAKIGNYVYGEYEKTTTIVGTYSYEGTLASPLFSSIKPTLKSLVANSDNLSYSFSLQVYDYVEQKSIYFSHSLPVTAYDMFNKAQLTTSTIFKEDGTPIVDTPLAFVFEGEEKTELQNTQIVETMYTQQNLYQMLYEIGKYIHARPKITFSDNDDTLRVGWKRYGVRDVSENNSQRQSIYNSRFLSEYFSDTSSYVTNMVQLGGQIVETVAVKSNSEDYLVYNDVAELIFSKTINEIIKLEAKAISAEFGRTEFTDITNFVYEKSIYQLLGVNSNITPNKGFAIYYELGENKIKGLTYKLPSVNEGEQQYAIKNILFATGITDDNINITLNNFVFRLTYRTKDTLRVNQTRPDLRKYLLNSKYDNVPIHSQFSNQTDVVVDSEKLGIKTYGELIRTGNTVFSINEWNTSINNIKNAGELYEIEGNLYYVSKVKHTFYPESIFSVVEYSKDFNRLSQIISIPSEQRFYEISERSSIKREVAVNSYVMLGTHYSQNVKHSFLLGGIGGVGTTVRFDDIFSAYNTIEEQANYTEVITSQGTVHYTDGNGVRKAKSINIDNYFVYDSNFDDGTITYSIRPNGTELFIDEEATNIELTFTSYVSYGYQTENEYTGEAENEEVEHEEGSIEFRVHGNREYFVETEGDPTEENQLETTVVLVQRYFNFDTGEYEEVEYQVTQPIEELFSVDYEFRGNGYSVVVSSLENDIIIEDYEPRDDETFYFKFITTVKTTITGYSSTSSTNFTGTNITSTTTGGEGGMRRAMDIIFGETSYPKFAVTCFKNDEDLSKLEDGQRTFKKRLLHPVCGYSVSNTLVLEWDMEDNFSAGNSVGQAIYDTGYTSDTAYRTLIPTQYTDIYGRADLFDFLIYDDVELSNSEIMNLPNCPDTISDDYLYGSCSVDTLEDNSHGIALLKDNREQISINYNMNMLTESDRFLVSAWLWSENKKSGTIKLCLLSEEMNKMDTLRIKTNTIIETFSLPDLIYGETGNAKRIRVPIASILANVSIDKITSAKAIAIAYIPTDYQKNSKTYYVCGRNVDGLSNTEKKQDWYISEVDSTSIVNGENFFKKQ